MRVNESSASLGTGSLYNLARSKIYISYILLEVSYVGLLAHRYSLIQRNEISIYSKYKDIVKPIDIGNITPAWVA
jgi:hypothetical protein